MRDRLIELFKGAETKVTEMTSTPLALEERLGIYADYLLANGVIFPPCKVGDTFYAINETSYCDYEVYGFMWCKKPDEDKISLIAVTVYGMTFIWGEEAFLTKEEAESKLKECAE